MTGRLFSISNHHAPGCGEPPELDGDDRNLFCSYFENGDGEQALYVFDRTTGVATVRLGDAGWTGSYEVVEGRVPGLVLGEAEALWVRACWLVTGGR